MTLVSQHILKYLLISLVFLTSILTTGVWLTQSLRFVDVIVNKNVSIGGYFSLVGLLIPDLLAIVLPICILISVLFTYNKLIADHELSIFRSCGLSNWRLARPALLLSLAVACFVGFINIYVVPLSFRYLRDMEHELRNEFSSNFVQDGMFNTLRGVTVYVRTRATNGDLDGVFIHGTGQNEPKRNPFTIIAQHGTVLEKDRKKSLLMLFKGTRQEKDENTGNITFFHFEQLTYDLNQIASTIQERIRKPYERSLSDLFNPPEVDLPADARAQLYAEGHQRLLPPFLVILFTLVGLNALLPQELSRRGRQKHIMAAIGLTAFIHVGLVSLINISGHSPLTILSVYLIMASIALFSFIALEKQGLLAWWQQRGFRKPLREEVL